MDASAPESIIIAPLRPEDSSPARELILAGLEEHWGWLDSTLNPDLRDLGVSYANATFLVARGGERIVGTGALIHEAEGVARIVRMSVAREMRRRGIGRMLLARLIDAARVAGYRQIVLETTSTWQDAIAFYQRCGFQIIACHDGETHMALTL